jgi:hypothetical protein
MAEKDSVLISGATKESLQSAGDAFEALDRHQRYQQQTPPSDAVQRLASAQLQILSPLWRRMPIVG